MLLRRSLLIALVATLATRNGITSAGRAGTEAPDDYLKQGSSGSAPTAVLVKFKGATPEAEARRFLMALAATDRRVKAPTSIRLRSVFGSVRSKGGAFAVRARRAARGLASPDLQGIYEFEPPEGMSVTRLVALLQRHPRVEFAQPDHVQELHAVPNDPYYHSAGSWGQPYADLWNLKKINLEAAWEVSRGDGVVVAVVDSGVYVHPELAANMWQNPRGYSVPSFIDFVDPYGQAYDFFGHGTHVAGIIAAQGDNGVGLIGVAPRAQIMPVRVADANGQATSARVAAGIVWATDNGADVINSSGGCAARCPSDPVVEFAVRYAMSRGSLVVLSAGNRGDDLAFYSPQNMVDPRPIVVASTDHLDRRESFSNYGAFVDLAAPGGGTNFAPPSASPVLNILSLMTGGPCPAVVCGPPLSTPDNAYLRRAGTSMSAAHVSGVAALILAADPTAGLDTVRRRIFGNVVDVGPPGPDLMSGWGRLDASRAVSDSSPYALAQILQPAAGETVGGTIRVAGTAAAHDLDLYELQVGAGATPTAWTTNGITLTGGSVVGSTVAQWDTTAVPDGTWTLRLVAHDRSGLAREAMRTVVVDNTQVRRTLGLQIASVANGQGAVVVHPPATFCANAPGATENCSYSYRQGTVVTLTAGADRTSAFEGWSGACAGKGLSCTVSLAEARSVVATFRGPYYLSIELEFRRNGSGRILIDLPYGPECTPSCSLPYAPGTQVTLSPAEAPLSDFAWLSGPCSGHDPCLLTMDQDHDLKGEFIGIDWPPGANAGIDETVEAGTPALLDGSWSADQDGDPIWLYEWLAADGTLLGTGVSIEVLLPLGVHEITLRVWSGSGASGVDTVVITVVPPGSPGP